jgi:hypothetical protein
MTEGASPVTSLSRAILGAQVGAVHGLSADQTVDR